MSTNHFHLLFSFNISPCETIPPSLLSHIDQPLKWNSEAHTEGKAGGWSTQEEEPGLWLWNISVPPLGVKTVNRNTYVWTLLQFVNMLVLQKLVLPGTESEYLEVGNCSGELTPQLWPHKPTRKRCSSLLRAVTPTKLTLKIITDFVSLKVHAEEGGNGTKWIYFILLDSTFYRYQ